MFRYLTPILTYLTNAAVPRSTCNCCVSRGVKLGTSRYLYHRDRSYLSLLVSVHLQSARPPAPLILLTPATAVQPDAKPSHALSSGAASLSRRMNGQWGGGGRMCECEDCPLSAVRKLARGSQLTTPAHQPRVVSVGMKAVTPRPYASSRGVTSTTRHVHVPWKEGGAGGGCFFADFVLFSLLFERERK